MIIYTFSQELNTLLIAFSPSARSAVVSRRCFCCRRCKISVFTHDEWSGKIAIRFSSLQKINVFQMVVTELHYFSYCWKISNLLKWKYCGKRQGAVRGVVYLATCWLLPQALHGLPPFNDASLRIIKQECLGLNGRAGYHTRGASKL